MEREELIKLIMERIYTRRIYAEKLADDISRLFNVVGQSEQLARKSCDHACGPSDYYRGGKCDRMGCHEG